jgi:prepilin signal peptidase PulO-like enzyme (type II secretory pathway)
MSDVILGMVLAAAIFCLGILAGCLIALWLMREPREPEPAIPDFVPTNWPDPSEVTL